MSMDQRVLVGLYIGSGSASAAVMLSDKKDQRPMSITWPGSTKQIVPLRVRYSDREDDANFAWGHQVKASDADNLFGIRSFLDEDVFRDEVFGYEKLVEELYRKRGKRYYHLPWSLYADLQSISMSQLMLFAQSVRNHILGVLRDAYSEASLRMEKVVCVAVPPYLGKRQVIEFKRILREAFRGMYKTISFIPQPQASFMCLNTAQRELIVPNDCLLTCHMEEEITTFSCMKVRNGPGFNMELRTCPIISLGSYDIADRFQMFLEERLADSIIAAFEREKLSSREALVEISKMKAKFLDSLNHRCISDSETFRTKRLGTPLTISEDDMRQQIFDPVLGTLAAQMKDIVSEMRGQSKDIHVLLSGPLAECPYVHEYMRKHLPRYTHIYNTMDEATSTSQGAVTQICIPNYEAYEQASPQNPWFQAIWCRASDSRLLWLSAIESRGDGYREQPAAGYSQQGLIRPLEMILMERLMRQGVNATDTKKTFVSMGNLLTRFDRHSEVVALGKWFSELYNKDRNTKAGPNDPRNSLKDLHLAAAFNDFLALQIMLSAQFPVNEMKEAPVPSAGNHTPLDTYAWYCPEADECVSLLLDAGAEVSVPSAARIAARKGNIKLLRLFDAKFMEIFQKECPILLMLAILGEHKEIITLLLNSGALSGSADEPSVIRDPLTGTMHQKDEFFNISRDYLNPHGQQLGPEQASEKNSNTYPENPAKALPTITDVAITKFLQREANLPAKSSHTVNQKDAELAIISIQQGNVVFEEERRAKPSDIEIGFISPSLDLRDTESVGARLKRKDDIKEDSELKDEDGRTELSLAASRGALKTVLTLLRQSDINSQDKDGRTPLSWAAYNNHWVIVDHLCAVGADETISDKDGRHPLSWAAALGNVEAVRTLLIRHPNAVLNLKDREGRTPLSWAACAPNEGPAEIILASGVVNVNSPDKNGRTPVSWAASSGHATALWLLLRHKAEILTNDIWMKTPLDWARESGDRWKEAILLCHKSSVHGSDVPAWVAKEYVNNDFLRVAVRFGNEGIVVVLLDILREKAYLGHDVYGETLLHLAARSDHSTVAKVLLSNKHIKAEVDAMDCGRSPLHLAAMAGHLATIRVLLSYGADVTLTTPNLRSIDGEVTARQLAQYGGHQASVVALLECEAKVAGEKKLKSSSKAKGSANPTVRQPKIKQTASEVNPQSKMNEFATTKKRRSWIGLRFKWI